MSIYSVRSMTRLDEVFGGVLKEDPEGETRNEKREGFYSIDKFKSTDVCTVNFFAFKLFSTDTGRSW